MRKAARLARVLLATQYAHMLEYRAEIALWALSGLIPLVMMALWIHQADTAVGLGGGGGAEAGLSRLDLARYFLSAFVVRQFTIAWVVFAFEEDALQGRLSPMLLQPLHPLWRYLTAHLGEQATRFPFVLGLMALFLLMVPWAFWIPQPVRLVQAVLATGLAFAVNFLIQSLLAVLCFWSERASALERLHTLAMLFLSGLMAPLEVFPPAMRQIASWTPFPWVVHFPARLLAGAEMNVGQGFAAQLGWLALLLPLTLLLWRAGVRRYAAMGA
ncbi:MAG: ABC-2 family transporter protein [Cyanobacteriota bacterium]|nr:ABC-2 family transporter protein [Cyanobacteriota bacterium]